MFKTEESPFLTHSFATQVSISCIHFSIYRTYVGLKEFEFDKVWKEMENYNPLLIDLLTTMVGKENDFTNLNNDFRMIFCFIWYP